MLAAFDQMQNEHVLQNSTSRSLLTPMEMPGIAVYENKFSKNVAEAATS